MASQGQPTRVQPPPPPPPPQDGLDVSTLVLSAIASAVAAYVTSQIWARGALASAALSPVIVALVKEGLRKPTEVVTAVVPTRTGRGRTRETAALPDDLTEQFEGGAPPPYPPPEPGAEAGPVSVYSTRGNRLRWRLAVITGLLGFAICVVIYTVPDLVAGRSIAGSGHRTTLFSGARRHHTSTTTTPTTSTTGAPTTTSTTPAQTQTQPAQTVTQTVTTPAPAPQQGTPSNTAPPGAATPAPAGDGTATTP